MGLAHADIEVPDRVSQIDIVERKQLAGHQRPARDKNQQAK